jgi:type VI protein secretion system component Hcp
MDILMDCGNTTTYVGESNITNFTKLIVCDSFTTSANQPLDHGRGTNRTKGTLNFSEIPVRRQCDQSSVSLLNAMFTATVFPTMKFHFIKSSAVAGEGNAEFLTVELTNALIASISQSAAANSDIMGESLAIGFTAIKTTYKVQDEAKVTITGSTYASFDLYAQTATKG